MLTPWGCQDGDLHSGCGVSHLNLERLVGWVGGRVSQAGTLPRCGAGGRGCLPPPVAQVPGHLIFSFLSIGCLTLLSFPRNVAEYPSSKFPHLA